jgi:hypothetical protein
MAFGPAFPPAPAGPPESVSEFWRKLFAEGADIGSSDVLACCLDPHPRPEIELAQSNTQPPRTLRAPIGMQLPWVASEFLGSSLTIRPTSVKIGSTS